MPFCPKCRAEYREGFTVCSACDEPLVDTLPAEELPQEQGSAMSSPVVVCTAADRLEAEAICDLLKEAGVAALLRPAAFQKSEAYCKDFRFGAEIVVEARDLMKAQRLIEQRDEDLAETPIDEQTLAQLAEEQAAQTPAQPAEDNAAFRLLPVILVVIAAALVLLYLIVR